MVNSEIDKHIYTNRQGQTAEQRAAYEQAGPDLTQIRVAVAESNQYPLLGELTIRAYEPVMADLYSSGFAEQLADVAERAHQSTTFVALFGDFVIGGVEHTAIEHSATLDYLAVDPSAQGLGAGRMLVETCVAKARAEDCLAISASLSEAMIAATGLLQSIGFVAGPEPDRPAPATRARLTYRLDLK